MKKYTFQNKARTLSQLKSAIKKADILPLIFFNITDWKRNSELILSKINKTFFIKYIPPRCIDDKRVFVNLI